MVKIISLSNEAYEKLKLIKNGKSFSEIVVDLLDKNRIENKKKLIDFFGIWKNDKEVEKIKKKIYEDRRKSKLKEVKF